MATPDALLQTWVIYEHPTDYPDEYVVRQWGISAGDLIPGEAHTAATLVEARALVPPGLFCMRRQPDDDVHIVETWL